MTDARLRELRQRVRAGELPDDLLAELKDVARSLSRRRLLPPSFAPYGVWNEEAAEEVFSSWYMEKLLGRGQLQALLDRAGSDSALRALAGRSLRQHLINAHDRSQSHNLYRRLVDVLGGDRFELRREAKRFGDRWFAMPEAPDDLAPWTGDDRALAALAWSLGDFNVIRYGASSKKLSPVLDSNELERFAAGLTERAHALISPDVVMRALVIRFDLDETLPRSTDEISTPIVETRSPEEDILLRDTARSIVADLTTRQREILRRTGEETVADLAESLGCSVGTIVNEQRRIGAGFSHLSADAEERDRLLKIGADLVYLDDNG
ncbi:MAG: hypothetical protein JSS97_00890 [Actinobacteria bacterium]|nr:hypothetical protein [Actinomycetota bacterium]